MPGSRIKPAEMYGITRCKNKDGKSLGWQIETRRRGVRLHKSFYNLMWGGAKTELGDLNMKEIV